MVADTLMLDELVERAEEGGQLALSEVERVALEQLAVNREVQGLRDAA